MSDYSQYPWESLQVVGSDLREISEQIGSTTKNAFEISGLTGDQDRIRQALADFRTQWEPSVQKLGENIGGFGDASTQIGTLSAQFDADLAHAMSPGGRTGHTHSAGRSRAE